MDERGLRPVATRWGAQTALAVDNFPISGERMPTAIIDAITMIKAEAAWVNADLGVVERAMAGAIRTACGEILAGEHAGQFPVDVFQTGSGTSTNMNVNEVVAHRASELYGQAVHPNDHVNASQSSNDVVPSAIRIAAATGLVDDVLPALGRLHRHLAALSALHEATVTVGRTHLMDAAPITFGQEAGGWARMVELGITRISGTLPRVCELPIGGTAVGTGLNAPEGFGAQVAERLAERTGLPLTEALDHFEAQSCMDAAVEVSAMCRTVGLSLHKIAGDLRLLGSGPNAGLAEVRLPALQPGSSIMPGKVNPVIPEAVQQVAAQLVGNDATIAFASTASTLQLNTAMPLVGRALVSSVGLLASAARVLGDKCIAGLTVDAARMRGYAERSTAVAMILVPLIGYDDATRVAEAMQQGDLDLAGAMESLGLDPAAAVDLLALARGNRPV